MVEVVQFAFPGKYPSGATAIEVAVVRSPLPSHGAEAPHPQHFIRRPSLLQLRGDHPACVPPSASFPSARGSGRGRASAAAAAAQRVL